MPHLATCIFLFFYNEPELGVGIDPGMALTPLPSSIGQGLNPQPSDCEPSTLLLDQSFRFKSNIVTIGVFSHLHTRLFSYVTTNYRAFHRFKQAKFSDGGSVLGLSQFSKLPQLPP